VLGDFRRLVGLARRRPPGFEGQLALLVHSIITDLLTGRAEQLARLMPADRPGTEHPRPLRKALQMITLFYHQPLTTQQLAAEAGVSRAALFALFAKHLGTSPGNCLREYRLHHAQQLLAHTSLSVKEICTQIGIEDAAYFSRLFRRQVGQNPRRFRLETQRQFQRRRA